MLRVSDYRLPEQLGGYREALRRFMHEEGEELARQVEEDNALPPRLWEVFREAGLFRLTIPKQYGGFELTPTQYAPLLEEVAHSHGAIRLLVHMFNWFGSAAIVMHGTEEQRRRYLEPMARGEDPVGFALTEPEGGTGRDIKTTGRRQGQEFLLNGRKHLISYANIARALQVVVSTDPSKGVDGITMFLVERDTPNFSMKPMPDGMGMRGSYHGVLSFEDAPVPESAIVGGEGQGLYVALDMLDLSRCWIALSCVGLAQEMLDRSLHYAWKRVTFGKPIAERQAVQGIVADMETEVAAARALTLDIVRRGEAGEDIRVDAAKAKLFGIQMVRNVSDKALEVHGGVGYLGGMPIERLYRDARALWFEEGSPTIQRQVIARSALARTKP